VAKIDCEEYLDLTVRRPDIETDNWSGGETVVYLVPAGSKAVCSWA
jgi:hypothetical protein